MSDQDCVFGEMLRFDDGAYEVWAHNPGPEAASRLKLLFTADNEQEVLSSLPRIRIILYRELPSRLQSVKDRIQNLPTAPTQVFELQRLDFDLEFGTEEFTLYFAASYAGVPTYELNQFAVEYDFKKDSISGEDSWLDTDFN